MVGKVQEKGTLFLKIQLIRISKQVITETKCSHLAGNIVANDD